MPRLGSFRFLEAIQHFWWVLTPVKGFGSLSFSAERGSWRLWVRWVVGAAELNMCLSPVWRGTSGAQSQTEPATRRRLCQVSRNLSRERILVLRENAIFFVVF